MSKDRPQYCHHHLHQSSECMRSELELFAVPKFQSQLKSWKYVDYFPLSSLDKNGPVEFLIKSQKSEYFDLLNTVFIFEASIKNDNGNDIAQVTDPNGAGYAKQFVAPINSFHSSHFKSVEVLLNGTLISVTDNMYGYKAYLQKLLSYDYLTKDSILPLSQYYNDTGNITRMRVEEADLSTTECEELTHRYNLSKHSSIFSCLGRIHSELFLQPKFVPGNNEIRIKFHRADAAFSCIAKSDTNYTVDINKAIMRVKQYEIPDHILNAHNIMLEKSISLKYPVKHVEMKFFTKGSGRTDLSEQNIHTGTLPNKVIVGLVDSQNFNGHIQKNPFDFKHFSLKQIRLRKNGVPVPYEVIECDYDNNLYADAFFSLYQTTREEYDSPLNIGVSYDQYKKGYSLYGFDLSATKDDSCLDLLTQGKLSLNINLSTATSASVTIVVYLEFSKLIEIGKDGKVTTYGKTTW